MVVVVVVVVEDDDDDDVTDQGVGPWVECTSGTPRNWQKASLEDRR